MPSAPREFSSSKTAAGALRQMRTAGWVAQRERMTQRGVQEGGAAFWSCVFTRVFSKFKNTTCMQRPLSEPPL